MLRLEPRGKHATARVHHAYRRCGGSVAVEDFMKLHKIKECLHVHISDISGSIYDNVNMSGRKVHDVNLFGLKITKSNLQGAAISDSCLDGMTVNGILVTDRLTAYEASKPKPATT
jgi:hypothetical protein